MSKQSESKDNQGYDPKPRPQICRECKNFQFDKVFDHEYLGKKYYRDKNLKCCIGGFTVRKTATCKQFTYS